MESTDLIAEQRLLIRGYLGTCQRFVAATSLPLPMPRGVPGNADRASTSSDSLPGTRSHVVGAPLGALAIGTFAASLTWDYVTLTWTGRGTDKASSAR